MTLHVVTITPEHIFSVSDRLISTSGGSIELDDDRFKHITLQTDDARAVISFAGFAGRLDRYGKLNETTADWLTSVLSDTSKAGHHGIDKHLTDIRDRTNQYLNSLKKEYPPSILQLAIIISGWAGGDAFNCVMDNCVEAGMKWSKNVRDSLTVRIRKYAGDSFPAGCYVVFLCNESIAIKQKSLRRVLQSKAIQGDVEGIFNTSVEIIRAASADPESKGTIGIKCSGIHIPKNAPGFAARHDRVDPLTWTIIPNHVDSSSHLPNWVHQNDEVHRPKPATNLGYLNPPAEADTLQKQLAFWQRAIEKLRLLHNGYGAEVRDRDLKYTLHRFHEWQRNSFNPVNDAAQNEMNLIISQLQQQDPDKYGIGELARPILDLKSKNKQDITWDNYIDLSDVVPFE